MSEYILRARPHEGPNMISMELQWLHENGQLADQAIYFEIGRAPEMLRALATSDTTRLGADMRC